MQRGLIKKSIILSMFVSPDHSCEIRSSERQECGPEFKAPFVTPEQCLLAGCCYDDMFMKEPSVKFYTADGRTRCFKKKGGRSYQLYITVVEAEAKIKDGTVYSISTTTRTTNIMI